MMKAKFIEKSIDKSSNQSNMIYYMITDSNQICAEIVINDNGAKWRDIHTSHYTGHLNINTSDITHSQLLSQKIEESFMPAWAAYSQLG